MAKIRVYELAKDLNMTNRELLEKIADLNIEISSHMSSLDDDSVSQIKIELFGNSEKKMDEKRIHPTVIRRRKKPKKVEENKKIFPDVLGKESGVFELAVDSMSISPEFKSEADKVATVHAEGESEVASNVREADDKELPFNKINSVTDETAKIISRPKPEDLSSTLTNRSEQDASYFLTSDDVKVRVSNAEQGYSSDDVPQPDKLEKSFVPSSPEMELPTENMRIKSQKGFLQEQELDTSSGKSKDVEISKPKQNRSKKDRPAKSGRQKDIPAKIIKRPDLSRIEPRKDLDLDLDLDLDKTSISSGKTKLGNASVSEITARKISKKKKIFKKREVVEGAALYSGKRKNRRSRKGAKSKHVSTGQKTQITTAKAIKRRVKIDETIIIADLAKRLGIKANEMIVKLMSMGVMVTVNQTIDFDTACLVANEFSYEVEKASFEEETILRKSDGDDPVMLVQRPPVVTIMGHVDHGKTSLLDAIRETRVTEREAGGITQHIGAYRVKTLKGVVAFLDTPGHEAFSAMRSRGARVTDLVVLVVAADDGVMPQTVEAINHSKASNVPILVAINKMDKLDANPERVLRELAEHGLVPEEWGGDLISVKVSAKKNQGIDALLEMILLQAEMLELRANPNKLARGHVVESRLDSGRGPVATVLVQEGTLRSGDSIVCGMHYGKVRALEDDVGHKVDSAGPSMPVEMIGLSGVPMAGDELVVLEDEKDARQVSLHRTQKQRSKELAKTNRLSLEGLFERMQKGEVKDLNLIIKADVDGSIEALKDSLVKLSNDEVSISVVHAATGTISESDVSLAAVSNAIIIGFNVRPNVKVQEFASDEHVDIRFYDVIYGVIKDVKDAIVGMMDSTYEEHVLGRADVRQVFHVPKIGTIAGCYVTDGKVVRNKPIRLLRDGVVIYQGKNSSLRRFKDDTKEVHGGYECGIGIENFNDIKVADVIESYYMEEIKPEID